MGMKKVMEAVDVKEMVESVGKKEVLELLLEELDEDEKKEILKTTKSKK
jgi:hypothetical protein